MEEGTNKGGILADDMGLGKTISSLALILSRPSTDHMRKVCHLRPENCLESMLTSSRQLL
jgi:SNF2 family DNA or RNA helicase